MNLHGDIMFNLNALFGGYNANRVYEIIPYIGAGWAHSYTRPHINAATFNAGLINRFRLCSALDLNLELSATGLEGKFDGQHGKRDYDGILGATVGVTYFFQNRGFQRPTPQIISALELQMMRDQMNAMAAANMQLQQQLANAKTPVVEAAEVVVKDAAIAPRTVFFTIGSSKLTPQEEMNISYVAKKMQQFPNTTYVINGYADSSTGTPSINEKLSLARAEVVKNILVKKYNISADRITTKAGGGVDKFGQPILNRVVLVESAK